MEILTFDGKIIATRMRWVRSLTLLKKMEVKLMFYKWDDS